MKNSRLAAAALAVAFVLTSALPTSASPARAWVSGSLWDPGYIISDQQFFDGDAMSAAEIQSFLNAKVPTCHPEWSDGPHDPIVCLKDYRQTTITRAADDYCPNAYVGASNETAATIIYKVAQACNVSPKVILVTLQKEQGLVTHSWPSSYRFDKAMGYGCPDDGTGCMSEYFGFQNQVWRAARQFQRYRLLPTSYNYRAGVTNLIGYHPSSACGYQSVYIQNSATAALYNYTPYVPNTAALNAMPGTGDSCSSYGNRNFWMYYWEWFGSPVDSSVPPGATLPSPVAGTVTTSNVTTTSIDVHWPAPNNGGATILEYVVRRSNDGGVTWLPGYTSVIGNPAATSVTVTGLEPETTYVFQVAVRNGVGWAGVWSPSSASTTTSPLVTVPAGVSGTVTATNPTANSIDVSWNAPNDGGSPVEEYLVQRSTDGGKTWQAARTQVTGSPAPTSVTVTGLTEGTSYVFQVAVRNGVGWAGVWSPSSAAVSTIKPTIPSRVTGSVAVSNPTATSIDVSWAAPSDGDSPILEYLVEHSTDGGKTWHASRTIVTGSPAATSATVSGLTPGKSYVFRVAVRNAVGWAGVWSNTSNAASTINASIPSRVTGPVVANDATTTSINVSWPAPADGGSPIEEYLVEHSTDGGKTWHASRTIVTGSPAATSATVSGLTPGKSYVFRVAVRNAVGWAGVWSNTSNAASTINASIPSRVTGPVVANDATTTSINVSWPAPADGGSPIEEYLVEHSTDGGKTWHASRTIVTGSPAATSATVSGLTPGKSYVFRVAVRNAVGWAGVWSNSSSPTTTLAVPTPSRISGPVVVSDATRTSLRVSWVAPYDGGLPILEYVVQRSDDGGTTWIPGYTQVLGNPAGAFANVTGLTPGTSYTFRVAVRNSAGWAGVWSDSSNPVSTSP